MIIVNAYDADGSKNLVNEKPPMWVECVDFPDGNIPKATTNNMGLLHPKPVFNVHYPIGTTRIDWRKTMNGVPTTGSNAVDPNVSAYGPAFHFTVAGPAKLEFWTTVDGVRHSCEMNLTIIG